MFSKLLALSLVVAVARADDYKLVWQDEFNGNKLNLTAWKYEAGCTGWGKCLRIATTLPN